MEKYSINTYKEKIQRLIDFNFDKHEAIVVSHGDLIEIIWKNPESPFYSVKYLFHKELLTISGDLGYAVVRLPWKVADQSVSGINLGYFHSKILASSEEFYNFDNKIAYFYIDQMKQLLADKLADEPEDSFTRERYEEQLHFYDDCIDILVRDDPSKREWTEFLNDSKQGKWYHEEDLYPIGDVIPPRVYFWIEGLKLAFAQIRQEKIA